MKKYGVMQISTGKIVGEHDSPKFAFGSAKRKNNLVRYSAGAEFVAVYLDGGPYDEDGDIREITEYSAR
jgi:hypothetical protein